MAEPRLSWINEVEKNVRNEVQTAYRILVASSEDLLEEGNVDMWDSGKVCSDQSILVKYAGKPLHTGADCYWKVMVWDSNDEPSDWSPVGSYATVELPYSGEVYQIGQGKYKFSVKK